MANLKCFGLLVALAAIVLIPIIAISISTNGSNSSGRKLVIDHDGGADDAIAIFMALLYEKYFDGPKVVALTTNNGNVKEDQVFINSQRILDIAKSRNVPIYRGASSALVQGMDTDSWYGVDGLGDTDYHSSFDPIDAQPMHAALALIELSKKHEGQLTVVAIGPQTNIALAIRLDPDFIKRLAHLYVGAGNVHSALFPDPEFNALQDVEAYHVVAENSVPDRVTIVPYSQTNSSMEITRKWREEVLGTLDTDIMRALNAFEACSIVKSEDWVQLDPVVMAISLDEDLIAETKYSNNDIVLCADQRGVTTNTIVEKAAANVRLLYAVKEVPYKEFLVNVFAMSM